MIGIVVEDGEFLTSARTHYNEANHGQTKNSFHLFTILKFRTKLYTHGDRPWRDIIPLDSLTELGTIALGRSLELIRHFRVNARLGLRPKNDIPRIDTQADLLHLQGIGPSCRQV